MSAYMLNEIAGRKPGDSSSTELHSTVGVISGGFDPIHSGHISLIDHVTRVYKHTIVGLNSDDWLIRKKGYALMPWDERAKIVSRIEGVYDVVMFDDSDDTAIQLLELMKNTYPDLSICFCNGGDRKEDNIPEINETGVTFAFNMGNKKTTSSRALFNRVKFEPKAKRWGEFRVVYSDSNIKIKLLHINPGSCLSYQKHDNRGELWVVKSGYGKVIINNTSRNDVDHQRDVVLKLNPLDTYQVHSGVWHQLINDSKDKPLEIMEMQYGKSISELDIVSEGYK